VKEQNKVGEKKQRNKWDSEKKWEKAGTGSKEQRAKNRSRGRPPEGAAKKVLKSLGP
jgi:hypothetical protein